MADDRGYDNIIEWGATHGYADEYDFPDESSFKDNWIDLINQKGDGSRGKGFAKSQVGIEAIKAEFGDLQEEYSNQVAEINTASNDAQLGQVRKRMGMSRDTFDSLFQQRAESIREARARELELEERQAREAMFKAERQRRAQYARKEIAAQKRRQAKSQERAVPRYSTPTFTVEREE